MYIDNLEKKILNIQKKEKQSSFEAYYTNFKTEDFKKSFNKAVYSNLFSEEYSDKKIDYYIIPRTSFIDNINKYLDELSNYIKKGNYNTMVILTNSVSKYKKVLELLNEKRILTLLVSDNKEDLFLEYSNLFCYITNEPNNYIKKNFKLYKLSQNT